MYDYYKIARDASWIALKECGIKSLPVDLHVIADYYDIKIVLYSECTLVQAFKPEIISGDGFITKINDKKIIFLNDGIKTRGRRRFTVGHELGHGILGHQLDNIVARNSEIDNEPDPREIQANVFSRDILAPACILHGLGVTTSEQIMKLCDISRQSAEIRLERLNLLRARNAFFISELECSVFEQFWGFIEANKLT